jgi:threonine/homoserine/homoserine lactone efflux protein
MTQAPTLAALGTFALLWWAQVAVPGSNFVRITNAALSTSRAAAMSTAAGVATGNALWCLVALTGAAIFQQRPELRLIITACGAAYFTWLGLQMLWCALMVRPAEAAPEARAPTNRTFWQGLASAGLNPQALVYFTAVIMGGFQDIRPSLGLALIVIVLAVTLAWYELLTRILDSNAARNAFRRLKPLMEGVFGLLLLAGALKLILSVVEN